MGEKDRRWSSGRSLCSARTSHDVRTILYWSALIHACILRDVLAATIAKVSVPGFSTNLPPWRSTMRLRSSILWLPTLTMQNLRPLHTLSTGSTSNTDGSGMDEGIIRLALIRPVGDSLISLDVNPRLTIFLVLDGEVVGKELISLQFVSTDRSFWKVTRHLVNWCVCFVRYLSNKPCSIPRIHAKCSNRSTAYRSEFSQHEENEEYIWFWMLMFHRLQLLWPKQSKCTNFKHILYSD